MAKLADALDLGSSGETHESSSLSDRTLIILLIIKYSTHFQLQSELFVEKNFTFNDSGINTLELILTQEEIQPVYDEAYQEAQKSIDLKGFRKGKVPMAMIKKMYGKAIESEANIEVVNKYFPLVMDEAKIKLIDSPALKDIQPVENGIKFLLEFQTVPNFEINNYQEFEIQEPVYVAKEDDVEKELDSIAYELAEKEDATSIDSYNYHVYYALEDPNQEPHQHDEKDEHGHHEHNHKHNDMFLGNTQINTNLRDAFLNHSVGESFIFSEKDKEYKIIIENVQKINLPEINDEFAKKASEEKFDNLSDYRQDLEMKIQDYWDNKSRQEMENQIVDHLIINNPQIVPPEKVVEVALENLVKNAKVQYKISEKDTQFDIYLNESYKSHAINLAKWNIIKDKLIEKEKLELEDYDYDDWLEKNKQHFQQYGLTDHQIREYINTNENVQAEILQKKLIDYLMGFATTNEISFDEFYAQRREASSGPKPLVDVEEYYPTTTDIDFDEDDAIIEDSATDTEEKE